MHVPSLSAPRSAPGAAPRPRRRATGRRLRRARRLAAAALPAIAVLALAFLAVSAPALASNYVGDHMDDFTLPDLEGAPVSLYGFGDDIVVVSFFATWCPPCADEAPSLENEIWQEYRDDGVTVLAVDLLEPVPVVRDWIAARGLTYPVVRAGDWDVFTRFPYAGGIPYNAIIDRDRILRYGHAGYERDVILQMMDELTGRAAVAAGATSWGAIKALYR